MPNEESEPQEAGIKLTQNWDLQIDDTGDIAAEFGSDEFEKDISYQTALELEKHIGKLINKNSMADMRIGVKQVLREKFPERVQKIIEVRTERDEVQRDTVKVFIEVLSPPGVRQEMAVLVDRQRERVMAI